MGRSTGLLTKLLCPGEECSKKLPCISADLKDVRNQHGGRTAAHQLETLVVVVPWNAFSSQCFWGTILSALM